MKRIFVLITMIFFAASASAYMLLSKEPAPIGYDVELDAYYASADAYTNLTKKPIPCLSAKEEKEIYTYLFCNAYLPRFVLVEASVYPLPWTGVLIRKNVNSLYEGVQVTDGLNLIDVVCAGFEEPYAYSVFLGNIVRFDPPNIQKDIKGRAYMGYLATFGSYHIKDCTLYDDNWYELEWKIKGDRITNKRIMKWSYRIGTKQHGNSEIADVYYFSIFRDRVDFKTNSKSIFNNTYIEYRVDLAATNFTPVNHYFMVGKSFPHKTKKLAYQIACGFTWEKKEKYLGSLTRLEEDTFSIIIRPNIKF